MGTRTCGRRGELRLGAALCCPEVLSKHSLIISCLASPVVCPGEPWFVWGRGCSSFGWPDLLSPGSLGAGVVAPTCGGGSDSISVGK